MKFPSFLLASLLLLQPLQGCSGTITNASGGNQEDEDTSGSGETPPPVGLEPQEDRSQRPPADMALLSYLPGYDEQVMPLPDSPAAWISLQGMPQPTSLSLMDTLWLTYLSGNVYGHWARATDRLWELGFGNADDGTWRERAAEIAALYQQDPRAAGQAEADELQRVHPGRGIEFFCRGRVKDDGFEPDTTQVLYLELADEPVVVIAFRGTEPNEWSDLGTDLSALKENHHSGFGSAHEGFLDGWDDVRPLVLEKLATEGAGKTVWITGHSLGGALAQLAAIDILEEIDQGATFNLGGVITFGQPRIGDRTLADYLELLSFGNAIDPQLVRIRRGNDLVPRLPPKAWPFEYVHAGHQLRITRSQTLEQIRQDEGPTQAIDGEINDHNITGYYTDLRAAYGQSPANIILPEAF